MPKNKDKALCQWMKTSNESYEKAVQARTLRIICEIYIFGESFSLLSVVNGLSQQNVKSRSQEFGTVY